MAIMLSSHKHCSKVENESMLTLRLNFCPQQNSSQQTDTLNVIALQ